MLELLNLWRILRRWWWIGIIPVIITVALTLPSVLSRTPSAGGFTKRIDYTAAQSLEALPRTDGDYQDIWRSSELTVNAFTDWLRGSRFKEEVISLLDGQGVTVEAGGIGIAADNASSIGRIELSYADGALLENISDAVIEVLSTRSQTYFAQLGDTPASVSILNESPVTATPPPLADRFGSLVRIGLGVLAGIVLMAAAHFLDPFLRSRRDLEVDGLRVVGLIPRQ